MPVVWLLAAAALIETATGIGLLAFPNTVGQLLLNNGLSGAGLAAGRVAGIALLALGVGSWIGRHQQGRSSPLAAMLTYNVLAAIHLGYLGVSGDLVGKLLWPAVATHLVIGLLLIRAWFALGPQSRAT
jgi:hypothetical protein